MTTKRAAAIYPTVDEINALPEKFRQYIHDLETRCDKSGDVQTIAVLRKDRDALQRRVEEVESSVPFISLLHRRSLGYQTCIRSWESIQISGDHAIPRRHSEVNNLTGRRQKGASFDRTTSSSARVRVSRLDLRCGNIQKSNSTSAMLCRASTSRRR